MKKVMVLSRGDKGKNLYRSFADEKGYVVVGFLDDEDNRYIHPDNYDNKYPVIGGITDRKYKIVPFPKLNIITFIHNSVYINKNVKIGKGSIIKPMAMLGNNVKIGRCSVVDSGVCIEHDSQIGDYTYIGSNSTIGGSVKIGDNCLIGLGCVIKCNEIGDNCTVVNGMVINQNVSSNTIVKRKI